ncbi:MAG: hypothetical protein P9X24_12895 [Candidatus Hatepunaea meridiana]|nr:hypothetical protein [Candidatus Hatepunaea meridiana]
MTKAIKAVGMLSGGLDSLLALYLMLEQGIAVKVIKFQTPFFDWTITDCQSAAADNEEFVINRSGLTAGERVLDCEIELVDLSVNYLQMLHNPRYDYGRNVNPCIDCHILMLQTARSIMEEEGAQFVFTGEVLGQRPKSQRMPELMLISHQSGLEDQLLRPLSCRLLPTTLPEKEGWIDRDKLPAFQGRSRKPQIELAKQFGIKDYPTPAGGCILTDPSYSKRVKDLWEYVGKDKITWEDYNLLKLGRHLRINPNLKIIVGRDEAECNILRQFGKERTIIELVDIPGPVVLLDKSSDPYYEIIAARICVRYSKVRNLEKEFPVRIESANEVKIVNVRPYKLEEVEIWLIN